MLNVNACITGKHNIYMQLSGIQECGGQHLYEGAPLGPVPQNSGEHAVRERFINSLPKLN